MHVYGKIFHNNEYWYNKMSVECSKIRSLDKKKICSLSVKVFFWTLSIVYISIKLRFGSWIFFRFQVKKEGQKPSLLGPLVELASDLDSFEAVTGKFCKTCGQRPLCIQNSSNGIKTVKKNPA
jgi:hypothetical protein